MELSAVGLRVGLTGGIGSGKSTVAAMWQSLGAVLVDADAISRSLTAVGGAALPAIAAAFGAHMINAEGALDRDRMRQQVFANEAARRQLEGILHPLIAQQTALAAAQAGPAPVVFDVPLLTESAHWRGRVQRILVVDCSEDTQVQRVCSRSGWTETMVRDVMRQQASRGQRRAIADAVIMNDGLALAELQDAVGALWREWLT